MSYSGLEQIYGINYQLNRINEAIKVVTLHPEKEYIENYLSIWNYLKTR